MPVKYVNNFRTTLTSSILAATTALPLESVTDLPVITSGGDDYMYLTLENTNKTEREIVKVTDINTTTKVATVVRGQDGTTAIPWVATTTVECRLNSKALTDNYEASVIKYQNSATGGALRTVSDKLDDYPDAFDFLTEEQRADVRAGTASIDTSIELQKFLDNGGGYLNPGIYRVENTLVVKNRGVLIGRKDSWSPVASRTPVFSWAGSTDGVVLQVSRTAMGTQATSSSDALSSVIVQNFTIDGNDIAGTGLFAQYVTDESHLDSITIRNCKYGMIAAKMWYCRISSITAKLCSVFGIAIGMQFHMNHNAFSGNGVTTAFVLSSVPNSTSIDVSVAGLKQTSGVDYTLSGSTVTFTTPPAAGSNNILIRYNPCYDMVDVNSVYIHNLRAAQCGSRYNAVTNPYGFGAYNVKTGAGIQLYPNYGCLMTQVTSETNYGPGIIYKSLYANKLSGVYLEDNSANAVTDGEIPVAYGLILRGVPETGYKTIDSLYMHTGNRHIYLYDAVDVRGVYVLDSANFIESITSYSGASTLIKIRDVNASNVIYPLDTAGYVGSYFDATYEGTANTGLTSAALRNSRARLSPFIKQTDWASGTTLNIATITVDTATQSNGTAGCLLLQLNIGTGIVGTSHDTYSTTYLVNFAAWQRYSTLGTADVSTSIVQLGTVRENSAALLSTLTVSASVSIIDTSKATITLQITPTSTGTQARNSISASGVFLSGGLAANGRPSTIN